MLSDALVSWLHGSKFSILLSKFSTPEELFGPISIVGLKADEYRRVITGKMPEAAIAYIDEIFKGSSAILNTTLQMLNERTFRNDGKLLNCPLKLCIGASNEWPGEMDGGKELGALFDRFLFRKLVKPIASDKNIHKLLWGADPTPKLSTTITPEELDEALAESLALSWSTPAQEAFDTIRRDSKREGIIVGDRRLRKAVKATQAFAWLGGATEVESDHLEILAHVLWDDPAEQPRKLNEIVGKVANPVAMAVNSLLNESEQIINSANLKDLMQAAPATKKLAEISKKLSGMSGTKATQALEYVNSEIKRIKKATVEAL